MPHRLLSIKAVCFLHMLACMLACSKNDQTKPSSATDIQQFHLIPGQDNTQIDIATHRINVRVPDADSSGLQLAASFSLSPGATLALNGIQQISGITKNDFNEELNYNVVAADQQTHQVWKVQASNNDYSIPWGLGHFMKSSFTLDRNYNWYIDQMTSGPFASVNCGPASVTMVIKWADEGFSKTALDARQTYKTGGGWWYTPDIDAYLTDNAINHAIIGLTESSVINRDILSHQLDNHQIIILCLDMNYVRASPDSSARVDKFYPTYPGWGHFIVLKGYFRVDSELFFEAYDPYSFGAVNSDKTPKGLDRFYRYEDLSAAVQLWWNYAFVIAKKGEPLSTDAVKRKLNPARVPIAYGGPAVF